MLVEITLFGSHSADGLSSRVAILCCAGSQSRWFGSRFVTIEVLDMRRWCVCRNQEYQSKELLLQEEKIKKAASCCTKGVVVE